MKICIENHISRDCIAALKLRDAIHSKKQDSLVLAVQPTQR